jgi:hypothetical protein
VKTKTAFTAYTASTASKAFTAYTTSTAWKAWTMKTARTMLGLLLAGGLLALPPACGEGQPGNPDGSLDGDDGKNPDGLPRLEFVSRPIPASLTDVTLSEDETELVGCTFQGEVFVYDAETLEVKARVQLHDGKGSPSSYCRIKVIEGKVYAYYGNSRYPAWNSPRMVMGKVDLATREQVAFWIFPSDRDPAAPYNINSFGTAGRYTSGLEPTGEGNRAIFTLGANNVYDRNSADRSGVDVPFLDLETGELTMERRLDYPGNNGMPVAIAYDGRFIIGQYHAIEDYSVAYVFDLAANQFTPLDYTLPSAGWIEVNQELRTLIGGGALSMKWWVVDLDTHELLGHHENLHRAWCEDGTVLSRNRVALAYFFNSPPSILGVMDVTTGEGLASAWIPEDSIQALCTTRDSRRVFVGGVDALTRVEIPEELLQ